MTWAMEEWKSQTARFPLSHSPDDGDGVENPLKPDAYGVRILRVGSGSLENRCREDPTLGVFLHVSDIFYFLGFVNWIQVSEVSE